MSFNIDRSIVPKNIDFPQIEERVLSYWEEIKAFETSTKLSQGKPEYSFYDGPPFATGLPHYGHILAGTIKDIVTRYAYGTGHHVSRRFGWDCHGLPVEHEIDKIHSIKGPEDVMKMGIKQYNTACRAIVSRYAQEWKSIVNRFGRWIDFENDYKTMYPWFMESVWWTFKEIYKKDLVYKGFKVMPFSTACNTPLSNFETGQNYKDIVDPSIVIRFPKSDEQGVYFLAWTTTPWTLPSNLALVVNPLKVYVKIKDIKNSHIYILMESRLTFLRYNKNEYSIIDKFPGKDLVGCKYTPPFKYFNFFENRGAFVVYGDAFVTEDSGTGVVHCAPAFGVEDLRVCRENRIISESNELPCPVDVTGCFTDPVSDFLGMYVKDADSLIIKHLKEINLVFLHTQHKHSYPFCWRSDTPILYRAVPSWFIRVETLIPQLLENNKKCYWVPEYVRDKRFHNWLSNAQDWNVSRNRYWGTPIPLWVSEDGEEVVCVGSIEELHQLSGTLVTDLHRDSIDHITIPSSKGKGVLTRTSEVFDCWFESGSMPYSQNHYPFENKELFERTFPADFVAEGIDQTRGWFYTLLVLSTAIFNKPPFKNLVVNGLVLASDGQKMSKRKQNYPDPLDMVKKFGADCIRCYLINSPVVCGENLRFSENGLLDLTKEFLLPWFNAFRFLLQYVSVYEKNSKKLFAYEELQTNKAESLLDLDKWMLSYTQSFLLKYHFEMKSYRLFNLIPNLKEFIETLTKWYIRLNRPHLRGDFSTDSQFKSLNVLFHCVLQFTYAVAPVCPFLAEHYYQHLKIYFNESKGNDFQSIHYKMLPKCNLDNILQSLEITFKRFRSVVELVRKVREQNNLPMKHPLSQLYVVHPSALFLEDVQKLHDIMLEDLNVKKITYSKDHRGLGLTMVANPCIASLGKRLRGDLKVVSEKIKVFSQEEILAFINNGCATIGDHGLGENDIRISYKIEEKSMISGFAVEANQELAVLLNIHPDSQLQDEGLAREFVNKIQRMRKKAGVSPTQDISIFYNIEKSNTKEYEDRLYNAIADNIALVESIVKQSVIRTSKIVNKRESDLILQESSELGDAIIAISLYY
ncbi:hypothetical protein MXB_3965 [Myxobolus squamalis]|nr:hypothetical protein MXB_3965 [Myxobolus squamalis]